MQSKIGVFLLLTLLLALTSVVSANDDLILLSDAAPAFYLENKEDGSWIHFPFEQYDLTKEPYVNYTRLALAKERFEYFAQQQEEQGYTALVLGDFQRMLTFDELGIYETDSKQYKKAVAYQNFFSSLYKESDLDFYVTTDFQIFNPKISDYVGLLSSDNERLQALNRAAFEELFTRFPEVDGVLMRIGEGGKHYNGEYYTSDLFFTKHSHLTWLLHDILPLFEKYNKTLILRAWTVGIGDLGDLSSNPKTYEKTFSPFYDNKHLVISLKYSDGDFWYYTEKNPVLGVGELPQIVEYQLRREYEGYGTVANFLAPHYKKSVTENKENNPLFKGSYSWTLLGGWDSVYNVLYFSNFSLWTEINNHMMPLVVKEDNLDYKEELELFLAEKNYSAELQRELADYLLKTPDIVKSIYYIDSYAKNRHTIGGVPLPKIHWIYWDQLSFDHISLLHLVANTQDIGKEVERTTQAYELFQKESRDILALLDENNKEHRELRTNLLFQDHLLKTLSLYKNGILHYYQYVLTHDDDHLTTAQKLAIDLSEASTSLSEEYKGTYLAPALNTFHADLFADYIQKQKQRELLFLLSFLIILYAIYCGIRYLMYGKHTRKKYYTYSALGVTLWSIALSWNHFWVLLLYMVGCIILVLFLEYLLLRQIRIQEVNRKKIVHASITGFLIFLALITMSISFFPEKIWYLIYRLIFFPSFSLIFLVFLLILLSASIKNYALLDIHKSVRHVLLELFIIDIIMLGLVIFLTVEFFILYFPFVNEVFHLAPSILQSHGIGEYWLSQYSLLS